MKKIYTIGYTSFNTEQFICTLKNHGITCVVDVRSSPYSANYKNYNKENLERLLTNANILYRNYAEEFGARQSLKKFGPNGYVDFNLFAKSPLFHSGIKKIDNAYSLDQTIALMCAEKDPLDCHRFVMIGHNIDQKQYQIINILQDGIETIEETENRLVNTHFPNRAQISFFQEDNLTYPEMLDKSYFELNKKIGYKGQDN